MKKIKSVRRNIHTYPFKYNRTPTEEFLGADKAAIYVHIPFCKKKCHFCDYKTYTNTSAEFREEYISALCKEISRFNKIPCFPSLKIDALYIGGGTPSLLSTEDIIRILNTCKQAFDFADDIEIAIEFEPSNASLEKLTIIRENGFNRLSIGVQSFDDELLKCNNRSHNSEDAIAAFETAKKAGFEHINIDILYPMFNQTMAHWENTVSNVIKLEPTAITAYPIEIWPETAYNVQLKKNKNTLPDFELETDMTRYAFDKFELAGYQRCSTGGYHKPEMSTHYCKFLKYYWRSLPMLGFGVSAKSAIYDRLYTNISSVEEYVERINDHKDVIDFSKKMSRVEEMRRVVIRGLKMCEVSKIDFEARFGISLDSIFETEINGLIQDGYIENSAEFIRLTREGQVFDRTVYSVFYTDDDLRPPKEGEVHYGLSEPLL